jgi:diguanylate cyclase (GGDEF)-like protein
MTRRPPHTETTALAAGLPAVADYMQALQKGVAWLQFQPGVEAEFRRSHVLRVRWQARFWQVFEVLVGIVVLNAILGGAGSANDMRMLMACLFVHMLVSAALVALTFSSAYSTSYLRAASYLTPVRASAFAVLVADIIDTGGSGTAAMTINMFGLMFFSGLLLRQALPAAIVMVAAFVAALAAFDVGTATAAYSMTSLLIVFGLSGFVAWDTQRAARTAFLEHGVTRADASRDPLTGLANRRHFDARLESMWRSAGAKHGPVTVLLVDVDHFKAYNDGYGHLAGDEALRAVARAIDAEAGKSAVVARFGGEEMALIAEGLAEHEAKALAERLRRAVEELGIAHAGAPDIGRLTVSIGGTCIVPLPDRSANGALQLADQNLYAAKRIGRNRVVFHGDEYAMMQTGSFRHGDATS